MTTTEREAGIEKETWMTLIALILAEIETAAIATGQGEIAAGATTCKEGTDEDIEVAAGAEAET